MLKKKLMQGEKKEMPKPTYDFDLKKLPKPKRQKSLVSPKLVEFEAFSYILEEKMFKKGHPKPESASIIVSTPTSRNSLTFDKINSEKALYKPKKTNFMQRTSCFQVLDELPSFPGQLLEIEDFLEDYSTFNQRFK